LFVLFAIGLSTIPAFSDETILVNQQIKIPVDFQNTKSESQPFAYIVQITNDIGQTISVSYITGSLGAGQTLEQTLSYIPYEPGNYKVEKFLWSDLNRPTALTTAPVSNTITVVQSSEQNIQQPTQQNIQTELSAATSKLSYNAGETIIISGTASSESNIPIIIRVYNQEQNLITVSQTYPNSYGVYSQTIQTSEDGIWSNAGIYQIQVDHGEQKVGQVFNFSGIVQVAPEPEPVTTTVTENTSTIYMVDGSSTPGCEPYCFNPAAIAVPENAVVTWVNSDSAAHTTTSGTPADGPSGFWDSSLIMSGQSHSVKFGGSGTYDYFCMVHPWRTGIVIVGEGTIWTSSETYSVGNYDKYENEDAGFSISLPRGWDLTTETTLLPTQSEPQWVTAELFEGESLAAQITVAHYGDQVDYSNFSDSRILNEIWESEEEYNLENNFGEITPLPMATPIHYDGSTTYFDIGYYTMDPGGPDYDWISALREVHSNAGVYAIYVEFAMGSNFANSFLPGGINQYQDEWVQTIFDSFELIGLDQTYSPFFMNLSDYSVDRYDIVGVSGNVGSLDPSQSLTILVSGPEGVVTVDQISVSSNGSFSYNIDTASALTKITGEYMVRITTFDGKQHEAFFFMNGQSQSGSGSMHATVENADGSSVPGCEPDCFIPATVTIGVGGQVTFANNDTAAHTSTAGTPADGNSGAWDSSLVMTGQSYTTGPLEEGEYPYYCMVHPWMEGLVIVEAGGESHDDHSNMEMQVSLTVETDFPGYAENSEIIISGKVSESSLAEYAQPVTIQIINSEGNIVSIPQLNLDSNNEYSVTLTAGGPLWAPGGDYTVKAQYGVQEAETTFNYAGGSGEISTPPPPPEPVPVTPSSSGMHATVENADGSSVPGCEPDCFIPYVVSILPGGQVTFANNDTAAHTSTAGTQADGPSGAWDSSLVMTGQSYTTGPLEEGEYPYFCMVHPWMNGWVIVADEPASINVGTEYSSYSAGDMINISGNSTQTSTTITITITNSTSALETLNITSTSSGLFATIWQIPSSIASGTYTMTASDGILTNSTSFSVTSPATTDYPLTITTLHIYQDGSNTRYNVIGEAPPSTTLTFQVIAPDGSIDGTASATTGDPAYNHDGLIFNPESGSGWIMKICTPTNQCLEYTFGIGGSSGDYPVLISDTGSSKKPAIAMSGEKVHVTWIKESSPQEIHYKRSIDGGDTFGDTIVIGSSTTAEGPNIAVSENDVHIVWNDGAPFAKYAKSTDGGDTFTTVDIFTGAQASGQSGEIRWPDVSVFGDTVHMVGVAAYYPSYPNWSVVHQKSTDGGQTFDRSTVYSGDCCPVPSISHSGDNVYIAWERQGEEPMFVKSTNGGASFSSQSAILSGGSWGYTGYFDIVTSGGNVHIVNNSENGFDYWRSTDNGNTFSSVLSDLTTTWSGSQGYYGYPSIATSGPDVYIAYAPQADNVFFVKSTDSGQTFGAPNSNFPGDGEPAIAASGNIIVIAFETNNGGIYLLKSTDRGQDQFFGP